MKTLFERMSEAQSMGASSLREDRATQATPQAPAGLGQSVSVPLRECVEGEVMRPESCDAEIADMMERLSRLQTWLVMQCCQRSGDPEFRSAMSLIQDVRALIVERCFK